MMSADGKPEAPRRSEWWRPVVVTVLIVLLTASAPLAVVARWAHDEVTDTDLWVDTVGPLADDPAVQQAVIGRITTEITTRLDVDQVADQAVDALADRGLPTLAETSLRALSGPLSSAIEGLVQDQVTRLVESDQFERAWEEANRQAHAQLVAVLTGKDTDVVEINDNAVSVDLTPVIDAVKQQLIARGFTLAERLPAVQVQFTIFQSDDIAKAQGAFRLLSAINTWLPVFALLCLAGAIAVSRRRRRVLIVAGIAVAGSMLVLGASLNIFREIYLDALPTDQLPVGAAAAVYDALTEFMRVSLRALLVVALATSFAAWVTGSAPAPSALRHGTSRAIGMARRSGRGAGLDTGRFGIALFAYKTPVRITVLALAVLTYVMRDHPTPRLAITLLVTVGVILVLVELLSRPPGDPGDRDAVTDGARTGSRRATSSR